MKARNLGGQKRRSGRFGASLLHFVGRRLFGQQIASLGHQRIETVHQLTQFFLSAFQRIDDPQAFLGLGLRLLDFDVALFFFHRAPRRFAQRRFQLALQLGARLGRQFRRLAARAPASA